MFPVVYFRPHYCKCLGIQQGENTSLLPSAAMYLDSRGADENGAVTTLDQKYTTKEEHLLSASINNARGIHKKL